MGILASNACRQQEPRCSGCWARWGQPRAKTKPPSSTRSPWLQPRQAHEGEKEGTCVKTHSPNSALLWQSL